MSDIEKAIESSGLIYWDERDELYRVGLQEDSDAADAVQHIVELLSK